jgi:dihydroorotate dehydrogenase electron transfer subunit
MVRYFEATIRGREDLAPDYFLLRLDGCEPLAGARPGQFVMVRGEWGRDPLLPRAFSLLDVTPPGQAAVLIKAVGRATRLLQHAASGARLQVLGPLGTAFPVPDPARTDFLIAGGCGVPPLHWQAMQAVRAGCGERLEFFLGGRSVGDLPLLASLQALGVRLHLTTADGSQGRRGLVTEALRARLEDDVPSGVTLMSCGPNAMLETVAGMAKARGLCCYVSLESQMACGLGACLGCAVPARSRPFAYVCQDGPVFDAREVYP